MSARTVVVTGCAGFIGSHLTEAFLADGWNVIGVDCLDDYYPPSLKLLHLSSFASHARFRFEAVDLADAARTQALAARTKADVVVHLAAVAGVRLSTTEPSRYVRSNVVATQNVIDAWYRSQSVPLVFGSSSSVYGNDSPPPFSEKLPCVGPPSPYAATKRSCELLCQVAHHLHGVPMTMLRFFTVYGPRQRPDLAIRKFSTAILRDRELTVYGDGSMARDFTHVTDIVRGIQCAVADLRGFSTVNLGSSHPHSVRDLIEHLGTAFGKQPRVVHVARPNGEMDVTFADVSEAARRWGWQPRVSLSDGLADFAGWLRREEERGLNP